MVRQRRFVRPAVGQHAEALIDEPLVVEGLEDPQDGFHERGVERLVVVFEVDPAAHAADVLFPFVGVLQHRFPCCGIELVNAHLKDFVLGLQPQLTHGLKFCRQTVGIPAEAALDALAPHGLVARYDVFDVAGQQVAVVRQTVCKRRAVVEDELIFAVFAGFAVVNGFLEDVVVVPELQNVLFQRREVGAGGHAESRGRLLGIDVLSHERPLFAGPAAPNPFTVSSVRGRLPEGCRGTTPLIR